MNRRTGAGYGPLRNGIPRESPNTIDVIFKFGGFTVRTGLATNWNKMRLRVEHLKFGNRAGRSSYVAGRYGATLKGRVLDVGCDRAVLRDLVPGIQYTGIDLTEQADLRLDLEKVERLPFEDDSFDCVVCTDVLEHLESLHHIFNELVRVTRRHIIVSLPNNWANARVPIQRGHGSFDKYGLPAARPVDRHRWFFSLSEAVDFVEAQTLKLPISIADIHAIEKPKPLIARALRRLRYPRQLCYLNRYSHSLWVLLAKRNSHPS